MCANRKHTSFLVFHIRIQFSLQGQRSFTSQSNLHYKTNGFSHLNATFISKPRVFHLWICFSLQNLAFSPLNLIFITKPIVFHLWIQISLQNHIGFNFHYKENNDFFVHAMCVSRKHTWFYEQLQLFLVLFLGFLAFLVSKSAKMSETISFSMFFFHARIPIHVGQQGTHLVFGFSNQNTIFITRPTVFHLWIEFALQNQWFFISEFVFHYKTFLFHLWA